MVIPDRDGVVGKLAEAWKRSYRVEVIIENADLHWHDPIAFAKSKVDGGLPNVEAGSSSIIIESARGRDAGGAIIKRLAPGRERRPGPVPHHREGIERLEGLPALRLCLRWVRKGEHENSPLVGSKAPSLVTGKLAQLPSCEFRVVEPAKPRAQTGFGVLRIREY